MRDLVQPRLAPRPTSTILDSYTSARTAFCGELRSFLSFGNVFRNKYSSLTICLGKLKTEIRVHACVEAGSIRFAESPEDSLRTCTDSLTLVASSVGKVARRTFC